MTGGGSIFTSTGERVTHGLELHCSVPSSPNTLEINWGGNQFHLDTLLAVSCYTDPMISAGHPATNFNTYVGFGTGTYDGVAGATVLWTFTDAGEPGTNDMATYTIRDSGGNIFLTATGTLDNGNQQAH
jgi:hypothetical protein